MIAKKSPRPSFSAVNASDRLFSVSLICLPLPARLSANDSIDVAERPLRLLWCRAELPRIPLMVSSRSWSHSTGTWVRSIGITALSFSTGPPCRAAASWMVP